MNRVNDRPLVLTFVDTYYENVEDDLFDFCRHKSVIPQQMMRWRRNYRTYYRLQEHKHL